jgi:putative restriction endonuclease
MRFHWVSQNQTGNHEVSGGYMWCPKTNADGSRNVNYEMMRNVEPGDVVFSFRERAITHIGIVISTAYEARKPVAFGARGAGWLDLGWMVRVEYESVRRSFMPSMHMELLRPLLPSKYSPLQPDGRGNQMYFTTLSEELGYALLGLSGLVIDDVNALVASLQPAITNAVAYAVEEAIEIELLDTQRVQASQLTTTQKNALVSARVGQGAFREAVLRIEPCCRVSKVADPKFLRASHMKPWRAATDAERLDENNGLMLAPNVDLLFDKGYITFEASGNLLTSSDVDVETWQKLGIPHDTGFNAGRFSDAQSEYLHYHRSVIFRDA